MGTTQKTTYQYDPAAQGQYDLLQPLAGSALASEISDPYSNMFFNTQMSMGNQFNNRQQASGMAAVTQRARAMGMGGNQPLLNFQMGQQQRAGQANQSQLFQNLLLQAGNVRQQAISGAMNYRPEQTGQTTSTSGLGTWLPQVAGGALGVAGMAMGNPSGMSFGLGGSSASGMSAAPLFGYGGQSDATNSFLGGASGGTSGIPGYGNINPSDPYGYMGQ